MAQWWEGVRILVLASLSAQYFLVLVAGVRKFHIPPYVKVLFRLVHIGSDALTIFALARLFNRQKNGPGCRYTHASRDLELLWAPIVLMHLGGQVVITTYRIEDNEQWSRHILTSLSKVTVALYVLYKSWSSNDKRLLAATILLFILMIIRCFQKALDLKSSSFNALRKASSSNLSIVRGTNVTEEGRLDNFIRKAREVEDYSTSDVPILPYQLFLDFPCPYFNRLEILRSFWSLNNEKAYQAIEHALSTMTSFLYTKDESTPFLGLDKAPAPINFRQCTQVLAYATSITAICLVHTSRHKEAYSSEDIMVTFVLLYGTLVLELVYLCVHLVFQDKFSGRIVQLNLVRLLAHKKRHPWLRSIAGWLQLKDFLDDFWHMEPIYSCEDITELVRRHVKSGWKDYIRDNETYRRFNDSRGEWTLASKRCLRKLGWSLKRPFDETVILWHMATDICLQYKAMSRDDNQCALRCKQMSNYMMHLLFANPEMLMPGSRKSLFTRASDELESILSKSKDEMGYIGRAIDRCKEGSAPDSFIHDAWVLAKSLSRDELDDHGNVTRKWEVIQGVWVEMLCFSAGRCRGYLHAQTLGTGVEYLSYVWVLLTYTGMETFPEKLQRREGQSVDIDESSVQHQREDHAATTFASETQVWAHVILDV